MVVIFSGTIFALMVIELWGKFADKYGSYRLIGVLSLLLPIVPFLWILNDNPFYLIFVPSLISGISWAGLHLAENNFIYDNVRPQKRGLAISYYNMFWGAGVFLGAMTGAILIKFLKLNWIEPIIAIFIISGILEMAVYFWGIPKMWERKHKSKLNSNFWKEFLFKQAKPTFHEEIHEIMSIRKYLRE